MATMPTGDEIDIWFKSITADLGLGEPGHSHDPHSAISHVLNVARRNGTPYQPEALRVRVVRQRVHPHHGRGPMTIASHQVACPITDCADPLYINWSASYGLYPEDMTPGHPVPLPEEAHTNHWEVACSAGHVLVLPEGDNDHEDFSAWDRSRLLNIISQLSSTSAQVFS